MIRNCAECDQEFNTECELPEEGSHLCPRCSRRLQIAAPALLGAARNAQTLLTLFFGAFENGEGVWSMQARNTLLQLRAAIALANGESTYSTAGVPSGETDPYTEERRLDQQDLFEERQREVAE